MAQMSLDFESKIKAVAMKVFERLEGPKIPTVTYAEQATKGASTLVPKIYNT